MSKMHDWARRFSKAAENGRVDVFFDKWVHAADEHHSYPEIADGCQGLLPDEPGLYLWGADRKVNGRRQTVPRYAGRAKKSLQVRFVSRNGRWSGGRGRYLLRSGVSLGDDLPPKTGPQAWLASRFRDGIRDAVGQISNSEYASTLKPFDSPQSPAMRGLEAFPSPLVDSFRGSPRLWHAVDWALHGGPNLKHLWVAFLPSIPGIEDPKDLEVAEKKLICAAIRWRKKENDGLPPLLNNEDREP